MAIQLVLGIMNPLVMIVVAIVIAAEKAFVPALQGKPFSTRHHSRMVQAAGKLTPATIAAEEALILVLEYFGPTLQRFRIEARGCRFVGLSSPS